jgi:hypothetical protein
MQNNEIKNLLILTNVDYIIDCEINQDISNEMSIKYCNQIFSLFIQMDSYFNSLQN